MELIIILVIKLIYDAIVNAWAAAKADAMYKQMKEMK